MKIANNIIFKDSISNLNESIQLYNKIIILTQKTILNHCDIESIINHKNVLYYICKENEECKSIEEVDKILNYMIINGCDKDTLLLGVGGGTITDLTGFIASVYMRGIDHYFLPTTLLAMVDASIGGKTAINYKSTRNIIGSFKQADKIFINKNFLLTHQKNDLINGFAEIIKYAFILDRQLFEKINNSNYLLTDIKNNLDDLELITTECIKHKCQIVDQDFKDNGARQVLNFGHTIGHALETYSNFKLSHGLAVFHGMKASLFLSNHLQTLSDDDYELSLALIEKFNTKWVKNINTDQLLSFIKYDKKIKDGKINFILLEKIGKAYISNDISKTLLKKAVDNI